MFFHSFTFLKIHKFRVSHSTSAYADNLLILRAKKEMSLHATSFFILRLVYHKIYTIENSILAETMLL